MAKSSGGMFGVAASRRLHDDAVLVIGLGRFGSAIAEALVRLGHDVLAVDVDPVRVQEWADRLTHVVQADTTNEEALRQIGAQDFDIAVVAIGTGIEASILTTAALVDLGIRRVWAKALTKNHASILSRVGAEHVIFPERDAGARTARLLNESLLDFLEFEDGFAIAKMCSPEEAHGRTLGESRLRTRYGITVVGVKRRGQDFTYAQSDTRVEEGDLLIVAGRTQAIERFAATIG